MSWYKNPLTANDAKVTKKLAVVREHLRMQKRRQWLLPPLVLASKYDRSNSLPEAPSKISAIVPDVATVGTQVATVASQIALVTSDVAAFVAGGPVIPMAQVTPELTPVASNVAPITAHVAPVGTAIDSVVPKIPPVAGPVRTQGKNRPQCCETQQSNNSSSHIASLVFPRLSGLVVVSNPRPKWKLQRSRIKCFACVTFRKHKPNLSAII